MRDTCAARTDATLKNSLYDSYMRAIRWASDRVGDSGVIGFVTNSGFGSKATPQPASARPSPTNFVRSTCSTFVGTGAQDKVRRKEGGKVFGSGSRNTVAIFLLLRTTNHDGPATIHYRDIGDYLTTKDKLDIVNDATLDTVPWRRIEPNKHGDWINQRDENYLAYPTLAKVKASELGPSVFSSISNGVKTNRDAWVFASSGSALDSQLTEPSLRPMRLRGKRSWSIHVRTV